MNEKGKLELKTLNGIKFGKWKNSEKNESITGTTSPIPRYELGVVVVKAKALAN